jgi:hypothetical protein
MPSPRSSPLPPIPSQLRLPTFTTTVKQSGTIKVPAALPFYYAAIQSIWVWWLVDLDLLRAYVEPFAITPYDFGGGKGAVNINFFNCAALYGVGQPGNTGVSGFSETELNVVGFASKVAAKVPSGVSFPDFLARGEQTKRVGNMRLWVACDDAVAVAAGQQLFFENKFLTPNSYDVPSLNNPGRAEYSWTCHDPDDSALAIYDAAVDLGGVSSTPGNMSEWIDLSFEPKTRRPVGSRRNYFGMYDTYMLPTSSKAVQIDIGKSKHPMRIDVRKLIGSRKAKAVQTFASPTCIAEASAYYADI